MEKLTQIQDTLVDQKRHMRNMCDAFSVESKRDP